MLMLGYLYARLFLQLSFLRMYKRDGIMSHHCRENLSTMSFFRTFGMLFGHLKMTFPTLWSAFPTSRDQVFI